MKIRIIDRKISRQELEESAKLNYGDMVKGVVDLRRSVIALGGELHADAEAVLLEKGSAQKDLWGFNIYPGRPQDKRLEYTSFINIRPVDGNHAIEVQDPQLKLKIKEAIDRLIE